MKALVVGSGCCGASAARQLAECGWSVTIIDRRDHVAGNAYDIRNEKGILYHCYGPHVFFTNRKDVWDFVKRFGTWLPYQCALTVQIEGQLYPMPFQPKMLEALSGCHDIEERFKQFYPDRESISVLELLHSKDEVLCHCGKILYEKDCVPYNQKQWGNRPEQMLPEVLGRAPVYLQNRTAFRQETWQYMPQEGFTHMFSKMLSHPRIQIHLNETAEQWMGISENRKAVQWLKEEFDAVLYTGQMDALFRFVYGRLPYRSLQFKSYMVPSTQGLSTLATYYPDLQVGFTRCTDYRYLPGNTSSNHETLLIEEYPSPMLEGMEPYYVVLTEQSQNLSKQYQAMAAQIPHFYIAGRLADFRYYNMDEAIYRGLEIAKKMDCIERNE